MGNISILVSVVSTLILNLTNLGTGVNCAQIFQWDSGSPMLSDSYELYGYQSEKCVSVHGDSHENDGIIDIWSCQHKNNQKWTLTGFDWSNSPTTGRYALLNLDSGKCLTVGTRGGEPIADADGQIHVYQYTCDSEMNPYQLWEVDQSWDYRTYWAFKNVATSKCLSVSKGLTTDGAAMTVWTCDYTTPSTNQLYYFW